MLDYTRINVLGAYLILKKWENRLIISLSSNKVGFFNYEKWI